MINEVNVMSINKDYRETVNTRVQEEPEFAKALLDEAASLFLNGESETARLILRDLVNATTGFETLAHETSLPSKSLHRMLSAKGNPTMNNLTAIFAVLRKQLNVNLGVHTITCLTELNSSNANTSERAREFREWVKSHKDLDLPSLSDEAISRESIYGERD